MLKDISCYWDLLIAMQRKTCVVEILGSVKAMEKQKPSATPIVGMMNNGNGEGSDVNVEVITFKGFGRKPTRPKGKKAIKGELLV